MSEGGAPATRDAVFFRGISKRFGVLAANDNVSFSIPRGSFHALLGENGAGKTTLMRILAGELRPDSGDILLDGERCRFRSPRDARSKGIRFVHQHSLLIPNLSIVENFLLDDAAGAAFPKVEETGSSIRSEAEKFGIPLDPRQPVWELSASQRQWLEVFRAIYGGSRILILDEPTSLLSPLEGDALLDRLKAMAGSVLTVVLITHKLREVFRYADAVTTLRKGRWVATQAVGGTTEQRLASMMVGEQGCPRDLAGGSSRSERPAGRPLLQVKDVSCADSRGRTILNRVGFELSRGEVLGVAGVSGNGQVALAQIVAGMKKSGFSGTIRTLDAGTVERRYIPDDRVGVGTAASLSVGDNLTLRDYRTPSCSRWGILRRAVLKQRASERISTFEIKTPSQETKVSFLSGGNIQRVVVARELAGRPDLVVAHNPTAGLDLRTTAFVCGQLTGIASDGGAVLLVSEDLDELMELSDHLIVLHGGAIAGRLDRPFNRTAIGGLMAGERPAAASRPGPAT